MRYEKQMSMRVVRTTHKIILKERVGFARLLKDAVLQLPDTAILTDIDTCDDGTTTLTFEDEQKAD